MRINILAALAASALVLGMASAPTSADAAAAHDSAMKACASRWQAMKKAGTAKGSYKDFSKTCLAGQSPETGSSRTQAQNRMLRVETTPSGAAPANATAKCKDGSFSQSKGHAGACSHHGGVAKWLK